MEMYRKIIETADGSHTLFVPGMDEQYHSVNGAITESEYVFLEKGFRYHQAVAPNVFEVGFGTGLNALLTALEAEKMHRKICYTSIEKYPLAEKEIKALNYGTQLSACAPKLFEQLHCADWNREVAVSEHFVLHKINADLCTYTFTDEKNFDIVYFDAFGPDKQPAMWHPEVFQKIFCACNYNAVFVTYSAKGEIRRRLQRCGFKMERLPGPPGKRQMLRGIKTNFDN